MYPPRPSPPIRHVSFHWGCIHHFCKHLPSLHISKQLFLMSCKVNSPSVFVWKLIFQPKNTNILSRRSSLFFDAGAPVSLSSAYANPEENEIPLRLPQLIIPRPQRKNLISTSFCFSCAWTDRRERAAVSRQINRSRYSACLYLSSFIIAARHHVFIGRAQSEKEAQVKLFIASYQQLVQHFDHMNVSLRPVFWEKGKHTRFFILCFSALSFWLFD